MNMTLRPGDRFSYAGFDWVCLDPAVDFGDGILAIMSEPYKDADGKTEFKFDEGGCCDYSKSSLREKLVAELVPKLGADNLIPRDIDLVADNGDDALGHVYDLVGIMSCDEYRRYRKWIPAWNRYVWTCTPWKAPYAGGASFVRTCSTGNGGALNYNSARGSGGVAPLVIFKSSIFQSRPLGRDESTPVEEAASDEDLCSFLFNS